MPKFTNAGLVAYCESMCDYHSPYWYGTFGNIASEELYQEKRRQYKEQYEKWSKYSFVEQYGLKVHDCIGLIKGYLMSPTLGDDGFVKEPLVPSKYNAEYDWSANGLEQRAKEKGPISTIPEIPGIIVWKSGHVGVYIGNGWVIEERGHTYGTVKTRLADRPWTKWLKHPAISYDATPTPQPEPKGDTYNVEVKTLKRKADGSAMKDPNVLVFQSMMNTLGITDDEGKALVEDSSYGKRSEQACKKFQRKNGLTVDGKCGPKTWDKIANG